MKIKGYAFPQDVPLILGLLTQLARVEVMIRRQALPEIVAQVLREAKTAPTTDKAADAIMMDKIWRGCGFWLHRLFRTERPCLRRSLVLFRWRVRRGLPVRMLVGVDRQGGDLKGHAWIVTPEGPFREDDEKLRDYVVMLEFEGERQGMLRKDAEKNGLMRGFDS